ncbi:hypothetical protein WA1_00485 [Scytonema hofmannii PCC 7110]|uniref:Uncharacterized protein n=1 Tax=Scytonema hofmannii PCC 7110 TaxID=128403 RepID=A0A139XGD6_9CYAN|nr:hypothetical protein [Scytonema hofmannii]KYC43682.1 hypothetical protein WA1_00485 [Scytonema hofmannii PCC 7110]
MSYANKKSKGYIASVVGGLSGALLFIALGLFLTGFYTTRIELLTLATTPLIFGLTICASLGEILGCWLMLRWRRYKFAGRTAILLAVLIIPSWLLFLGLIFLTRSLIFATSITLVILPLIARLLTNHPGYLRILSKITNTFAKRP